MVRQPLLQLLGSFDLDLLGGSLATSLSRRGVARGGMALGLCCIKVCDDALVVLLDNVVGDTLHAEDLNVEPLTVGQRVLNLVERFLVHLVHVDGETAGRVQSLAASVALEVLGFLVGDEELEILKITFAWADPSSVLVKIHKQIAQAGGTYSSNTMDEQGAPRRRGVLSSFCPS